MLTCDELVFARNSHLNVAGQVKVGAEVFHVRIEDGHVRLADTEPGIWTQAVTWIVGARPQSDRTINARHACLTESQLAGSRSQLAGSIAAGGIGATGCATPQETDEPAIELGCAHGSELERSDSDDDPNRGEVNRKYHDAPGVMTDVGGGTHHLTATLRGAALQSFLDLAPDCRRARFTGTDFTGVDFGQVDCQGASFTGCTFNSTTNLDGAGLDGARFRGARLCGFTAKDLERLAAKGADLRGAIVEDAVIEASVVPLDLREAEFVRCTFGNPNPEADPAITGWNLERAWFTGCRFERLTATRVQAARTRFERCRFNTCGFKDVPMPKVHFIGCYMDTLKATPGNNVLPGGQVVFPSMREAVFDSCTLKWSSFRCDLSHARFSRLNRYDENGELRKPAETGMAFNPMFNKGNLTGARFIDSDLTGMILGIEVPINGLEIDKLSSTCRARFDCRQVMINGQWHVEGYGHGPARPVADFEVLPAKYAQPRPAPTNHQAALPSSPDAAFRAIRVI